MDITSLLKEDKLKIHELDNNKTYVFVLGNDEYSPTQNDLKEFRKLLIKSFKNKNISDYIICSNFMRDIDLMDKFLIVTARNRLDGVEW